MEHDYWGPGYTDEDIKKVLEENMIKYQYVENIAEKSAELVAEGKIIGWFQSRMEFGQRALGNRSIIADPRDPEMKDKINKRVKHRESFRPFTPSIIEEYSGEYFDDVRPSRFMQKVYNILPEKQKYIPAVTHVDGTGRLQTVNKNVNPLYWQLIDNFRKLTGIPVVLNTSFNVMGEPIVCTPNDAIRCFYGTGLDSLAIGNFLIGK
jgi:carbamoyltransferase